MNLNELYEKRRALHDQLVDLIIKDRDWQGTKEQLNVALCCLEIPQLEAFLKDLEEKLNEVVPPTG